MTSVVIVEDEQRIRELVARVLADQAATTSPTTLDAEVLYIELDRTVEAISQV